jgi:quercetin dioxygenase-like cupin family protein
MASRAAATALDQRIGTQKPAGRKPMGTHAFDDRNIAWRKLEGFDQISYYIYEIDEKNGNVDLLVKFVPHQQIMLHHHKASYRTLVIQGELRIFRPNGELKEVRPVGSYVISAADGEPHTECAGDEEAIVLFSNRNVKERIYEFLDADGNIAAVLGMTELKALFEAQKAEEMAL